MDKFALVAVGGALGAVARYSMGLIPAKVELPLMTLIVNLLGAVLIGFITGLGSRRDVSEYKMLFWKTGVCGGFTTFSTFSLEAWGLLEKGRIFTGGAYIILSVSLCILGIIFGRYISSRIASAF